VDLSSDRLLMMDKNNAEYQCQISNKGVTYVRKNGGKDGLHCLDMLKFYQNRSVTQEKNLTQDVGHKTMRLNSSTQPT
jgi:hypothetical protein